MPDFQKPLVAVVDDEQHKLDLARRLIEYVGCGCQVFRSGAEFLAAANRETACVILNARMAGMDGHEVYRRMRGDGWDVPVISESAYLSEEDLWAAYGGGQVAHLNCPYKLGDLEAALRAGLLAAGYCLPPSGVVAFEPALLAWHAGLILALARSISREGAFHLLPVLGDALEDAGCTNADALAHCRTPGDHRRGCWVLDRVHALSLPDSRSEAIVCRGCQQCLRVPNHLGLLAVRCPACGDCFDWSRPLSLLFVG
jgi:CheY-like chemotaxis protein